MNPLVSVLLPVFNAEKTIQNAVSSILNQSYSNFELLIINDGSEDASLNIVTAFKDDRIRIISFETNKGLVYALNKGINAAQGKYVFRMDADDISLKDRILKQVKFLENRNEIGILGTGFISVNSQAKNKEISYFPSHNEICFRHLYQIHLCHPTVAIRKSILDENSILYNSNFKHAEDYDFFNQIIKVTKAANLNDPLLLKENSDGNVSNKFKEVQEQNSQKAKMELFEWLFVPISLDLLENFRQLNHQDYAKINIKTKEIGKLLLDIFEGNKRRKFIGAIFLFKKLNHLMFHFCLFRRSAFYFYFLFHLIVIFFLSINFKTINSSY